MKDKPTVNNVIQLVDYLAVYVWVFAAFRSTKTVTLVSIVHTEEPTRLVEINVSVCDQVVKP